LLTALRSILLPAAETKNVLDLDFGQRRLRAAA
jgi:hypothetical protein